MSKIDLLEEYKSKEVLQGDSWKYWLTSLESKNELETHISYLRAFTEFLEATDYTTETLYSLAMEIDGKNGREKKKIAVMIRQYEDSLIREKKSTSTAKQVEKSVSSFFKANGLELKMFDLALQVVNTEGQDRAKVDIIKKLLDATHSLRNMSLITMLKDSGLRSGEVCLLNWGDVWEVIENPELEYFTWEIKQKMTKKTGFYANPVIGRDSIDYLRRYHTWCTQRDIATGRDDPVYVCTVKRWNTTVGNRLNSASVSSEMTKIRQKAGLEGEKISAHSLRKNHQTTLENSGVPSNWIYKMQGRKINNSSGVYSRPDKEELIGKYKKGYSALAFDSLNIEDIRERRSLEVDELKAELGMLKDFVQGLQEAEQKKPNPLEEIGINAVPTLGFSRDGEEQFLHPTKGVYKIVIDKNSKREHRPVEEPETDRASLLEQENKELKAQLQELSSILTPDVLKALKELKK